MPPPSSTPAKRAIRSKKTGLWFAADGNWTDDFNTARFFDNIADVVFTAGKHRLSDTELVLRFESTAPWDVAVDIQ